MRGWRVICTDDSSGTVRQNGKERGWGTKTEEVWERGDPVWTLKVQPFTRVIRCPDRVSMSACRPGLLVNERPAGKGRNRYGCKKFHEMKGSRKKAADGSSGTVRLNEQERGWGIKTEEVWERGDPVWTLKVQPFTRVIRCPDRVSMSACRPGLNVRVLTGSLVWAGAAIRAGVAGAGFAGAITCTDALNAGIGTMGAANAAAYRLIRHGDFGALEGRLADAGQVLHPAVLVVEGMNPVPAEAAAGVSLVERHLHGITLVKPASGLVVDQVEFVTVFQNKVNDTYKRGQSLVQHHHKRVFDGEYLNVLPQVLVHDLDRVFQVVPVRTLVFLSEESDLVRPGGGLILPELFIGTCDHLVQQFTLGEVFGDGVGFEAEHILHVVAVFTGFDGGYLGEAEVRDTLAAQGWHEAVRVFLRGGYQ